MDDKELCNLACNPSLDGYTPNPLYHSGYCTDYMYRECNADGSMFEEQWEKHQENINDYNARKIMAMTFHQRPQEFRYQSQFQERSPQIPPSTSDIFQAMYSNIPVHPAINTLPVKKKSSNKKKPSQRKNKPKRTGKK